MFRDMKSEQFISAYLSGLGLRPERFSKTEMRIPNRKTPDFKVFREDTLELYCEVKELTDADPLEKHYQEVAPGIQQAAQLSDEKSPINRLVRKIEDAASKFRCVNPERNHLNVLAVINTYDLAGPDNLLELLQGYLSLESGGVYVTTPPFLRERVEQVRCEIDLYWWIEHHVFAPTPKHHWLSPHSEDSPTFLKLRELFQFDQPE
jgi:hypothetical protein